MLKLQLLSIFDSVQDSDTWVDATNSQVTSPQLNFFGNILIDTPLGLVTLKPIKLTVKTIALSLGTTKHQHPLRPGE